MKEWSNLAKVVTRRTYARRDSGTLENWNQTVERTIGGNVKGKNVPEQEIKDLIRFAEERKCGPAGRGYWFSGAPAHKKIGGTALVNCWFLTAGDWHNFVVAQDLLMLGGGVGLSVEHQFVSKLPRVKKDVVIVHKPTKDADFIIPDSREGWCELTNRILESFFVTSKSFSYSTICVRGKDEPILGFGGTASGPLPIIEFVKNLCAVLVSREGRSVRPIDAADILTSIASLVVSGNVRRSACLIQGDCWDKEYLKAKRWDLGQIPPHRANANYSVVCEDIEDVHPLFWKTYEQGEPFGIINRSNVQKYGRMGELKSDSAIGVNPSLRAGTKVLTTGGIFPIEGLEDKRFFVTNLQGEISPAECRLSGQGEQLWEIELISGKKIYATKEHKWPVYLNGRFVKIETEELKAKDNLPLLRLRELPISGEIKSSYEEGFFVGWLYGDGWVTERSDREATQYGVIVSKKDGESGINEKIVSYLTSVTGGEYRGSLNEGNTEYNTSSKKLQDRLKMLGVDNKRKGLPSYIWEGDESFRKGFIDGIFSSDGTVEQTGGVVNKNGSCRVRLGGAHEILISQIADLLSFYGILTKKYKRVLKEASFPNGKKYERQYESNVITISGSENVVHFRNVFSLSLGYKQETLNKFYKEVVPGVHCLSEIVSITPTQMYENVWDISVYDSTHCFQIDHCVTGNCGEAVLENFEPCNLAEIALPNLESVDEFEKAARLMLRYTKRVTTEKYHHKQCEEVIKRNRRVGVGITGCLASPLFTPETLDRVYSAIQDEDARYSEELGIPISKRTTVVKPSGTMSKVLDCMGYEGIHAAFSRYMIQRVRFSSSDELIPKLRAAGHHIEPQNSFGSIDPSTMVVDFYQAAPEGFPVADEGWDTWKQLEVLKMVQKHWADQAVSVTVYYKKEDIPKLKIWLAENLQYLKTISFLCHNDHGFLQAPKEAITKEQYEKLSKKIKPIDFEDVGEGSLIEGMECESGSCPLR